MSQKGIFIALEGIDGSGKSTQIKLLAERLRALGLPCHITQEPTGGPVGRLIRRILRGELSLDSRVTASLFVADRLDHLLNETDGLYQKIAAGVNIITDRYYFSSYAYQSVDMPLEQLIAANREVAGLLRPTLTVFLDLPAAQAMARIRAGRSQLDLFEQEERLLAVRERYFAAFAQLKAEENVAIIDANADEKTVAERIWQQVKPMLTLD